MQNLLPVIEPCASDHLIYEFRCEFNQCHQRRQKTKSQFGRSSQYLQRTGSADGVSSLSSFSGSGAIPAALAVSLCIPGSLQSISISAAQPRLVTYQTFLINHSHKYRFWTDSFPSCRPMAGMVLFFYTTSTKGGPHVADRSKNLVRYGPVG